jgi:hypothetical protein
MKIELDVSRFGESRWYEYVLRFAFGGSVTVLAGLIAKHCGPIVGGLFLAFPAIFPAAAMLIEKHEKDRKRHEGMDGAQRARIAAGLDATGAAIGSVALAAFAGIVWRMLPGSPLPVVLLCGTLAWMAIAALGWMLRELVRRQSRRRRQKASKRASNSKIHTKRVG